MSAPTRGNRPKRIGLPPIAGPDAVAIVLGSMPGEASLAAQQYYAHPQNAFWRVMGTLVGAWPELPYAERVEALLRSRIAVWDVVRACEREGSLDSAIRRESVEPNDMRAFAAAHPRLRLVVCNGAAAHALFLRHRKQGEWESLGAISVVRAPSTSPAHAAMSIRAKIIAWREALHSVLECSPS